MSVEKVDFHAPAWFAAPGESDVLAWVALGTLFLAIYGVFVLYAYFDRWAEHKSHGTPLAKTIPTMLSIALLYEIFPLGHFNVLLPISAILIALMADWSRFHQVGDANPDDDLAKVVPVQPVHVGTEAKSDEARNV